ncbi:di-heme oxidoredictase family protein [Marinagarivorans algicola]|uniref:di-heme oxidoreductase family protein n=1 Tax=Marinagarivorans algicola TaxID=1513270 RepID=UPI0006B4D38E|nr:di-heme oxidoredictase family protein [Marinagarivorans algicola]
MSVARLFQCRLTLWLLVSTLVNGCGLNTSSQKTAHITSSNTAHSTSDHSQSSSAQAIVDNEFLSAGAATYIANNDTYGKDAYSHAIAAISHDAGLEAIFKQGDHTFRNQRKNTGPLINDTNCQGCHIADGRASLPANNQIVSRGLLFKLSLGQNSAGQDIPEPTYGFQLQTLGINADGVFVPAGAVDEPHTGEAFVSIEYVLENGSYPDGQAYQLRKPVYHFKDFSFGEIDPQTLTSPRLAPPMFGVGLLESIAASDIIGQEDTHDSNNDGISGKAKWVYDNTQNTMVLGRFGWKASAGSVLQQSAGAFANDMGVSNRFNLEEPCSPLQITCLEAAARESKTQNTPDINDILLAAVEFYSRTLAVPARRGYNRDTQQWNEVIQQGKRLFTEAACSQCHTPQYTTGIAHESAMGTLINLTQLSLLNQPIEALSQQVIYPYTDLLLHDMGGQCEPLSLENAAGGQCLNSSDQCHWVQRCEGLADGRPEGAATGREWRTSALWGIGLAQTVNPSATFLHDGRARTLEEAVLWHAGEAMSSLNTFKNYSQQEREALLAFLYSL